MASEYTKNYNLDLYTDNDKPNLRDQYNSAIREIDEQLHANATAIADETTRAKAAEQVNATAISDETTRAKEAEQTNATAIADETTRATKAEQVNATAISNNATAIDAEKTRAEGAEQANAQSVDAIELEYCKCHDTVADMQTDDKLQEGMTIKTKGFSNIDDGGAAFYVIKNGITANGMDKIECQGELTACMLYGETLIDSQLGPNNDSTFQRMFEILAETEIVHKLKFCGKYNLTAPMNQTKINKDFEIEGGSFYLIPSENLSYIFNFNNVKSCHISGAYFKSDMNTNYLAITPKGHSNSNNAKSSNVIGVYIYGHDDVTIENCFFDGMHESVFIQNDINNPRGNVNVRNCSMLNSGGMGVYTDNVDSLSVYNVNGETVSTITGGMHFVYNSSNIKNINVAECRWKAAPSDKAPVILLNNEHQTDPISISGKIENCDFYGDALINCINVSDSTITMHGLIVKSNNVAMINALTDTFIYDSIFIANNDKEIIITTNSLTGVIGSVSFFNCIFENFSATLKSGEASPSCYFYQCAFKGNGNSPIRPWNGNNPLEFRNCKISVESGIAMNNSVSDNYTGEITVIDCDFADSKSVLDFVNATNASVRLFNNYGTNVSSKEQGENVTKFNNLYKS